MQTWIPLSVGILGLIFGLLGYINSQGNARIGVVRSDDLVYKYAGMVEAQGKYKGQFEVWEKEVDSLTSELKGEIELYEKSKSTMSQSDRTKREGELALLKQSLDQHKMNLSQKASEEDRELTEGVLNQINTFVEEYGREHGYDVIIGTGGSGNVLHAAEGLDITEDVLDELNKSYRVAER
ncbi:MAG: OmpH family outer membrane protein [Candidatus Kapaibacterium sp.]